MSVKLNSGAVKRIGKRVAIKLAGGKQLGSKKP